MKVEPSTVLIADDDPDDLLIISDSIRELRPNTKIISSISGLELLAKLESYDPNALPSLIIIDLNMPGKDGRSTLAAIKNNSVFKFMPVVICTTSSSSKDKAACYAAGANCFVSKPNSFREFSLLFSSILDLWMPEKAVAL